MTTSLGMINDLGAGAIAAYTRALAEPLITWAMQHEVRIVSPTNDRNRSAIICIAPPNASEAHRRLKAAGVICALREGAIRFSPHFFSTIEEIENVIDVLDE